ncbi:AAA-ATPase [Gordonia phage Rabbitrun]|uniref:AAA-ATPase n=1 Tax=Gordonia phage Rabbitrun TaxID=2762280 RepID=A0A7G8LIT1_9CAUD|nr:AAA-ATPase [Gordonia phage Rabbitrun]QNJ57153.1 AAA-ATPase [Gordonia phage Rabbitrun]
MGRHSKPLPTDRPDTALIQIIGDRQSGKTEMVVRYLAAELLEGRFALYFGRTLAQSGTVFHRLASVLWEQTGGHDLMHKLSPPAEIYSKSGYGRVVFRSINTSGRGYSADTVVLDDYDPLKDRGLITELSPIINASPNLPKMVVASCG